ncbi:hypothetical protein wTpre_803, partial [Wolbachia endosymbiont of Trichogramma pretiosum]
PILQLNSLVVIY